MALQLAGPEGQHPYQRQRRPAIVRQRGLLVRRAAQRDHGLVQTPGVVVTDSGDAHRAEQHRLRQAARVAHQRTPTRGQEDLGHARKSIEGGDAAGLACPEGLEPPTCCLEGSCSIRLSYGQR